MAVYRAHSDDDKLLGKQVFRFGTQRSPGRASALRPCTNPLRGIGAVARLYPGTRSIDC
jgi:hypothetical protein